MNDFIIHVNLHCVLNPSADYLPAQRLTYIVWTISNIRGCIGRESFK